MTGEDLGCQRSIIEQAKFDYSPLGKVFTRGLDKDKNKKEGLFKRLKNIENKNKDLLDEMKNWKTTKSKKNNNKTRNLLIYDSKYNFEKYKLSKFNEIASIGSKFDMINKCCNDFIRLMAMLWLNQKMLSINCLYWKNYQKFMTIWLYSKKKIMKVSLRMIKVMLGSENMTLKILKT